MSESACVQITTSQRRFDGFYPTILGFLKRNTSSYPYQGKTIYGYRSPDTDLLWLRDHTHQSKGFRYHETELYSLVDLFLDKQLPNGAFYDAFHGATDDASLDFHRYLLENGYRYRAEVGPGRTLFFRCGAEADLEYLAVEAVHAIWQTTGNDLWMAAKLPALERGMYYAMHAPERWDSKHQLVKRPFTIDTWDFEYGMPLHLPNGLTIHRSEIYPDSHWCIMHGDNSGMAYAAMLLAQLYRRVGNEAMGARWEEAGAGLRERLNRYCWNGRFYTHQLHLDGFSVPGVDEAEQLSLSNTYNLNRRVVSQAQAESIILEYQRRRGRAFTEWFSIDPAFPAGSFSPQHIGEGYYVNGGIMPLAGGELARGAFRFGFEEYAVDILDRYRTMFLERGYSYLWYAPDGTIPPEISERERFMLPTDGWGSSAMLAALVEGLVGVTDSGCCLEFPHITPRWAAAGETSATCRVAFAATGANFDYCYSCDRWNKVMKFCYSGSGREALIELLLPEDFYVAALQVDGVDIPYQLREIRNSRYLCFRHPIHPNSVECQIRGAQNMEATPLAHLAFEHQMS